MTLSFKKRIKNAVEELVGGDQIMWELINSDFSAKKLSPATLESLNADLAAYDDWRRFSQRTADVSEGVPAIGRQTVSGQPTPETTFDLLVKVRLAFALIELVDANLKQLHKDIGDGLKPTGKPSAAVYANKRSIFVRNCVVLIIKSTLELEKRFRIESKAFPVSPSRTRVTQSSKEYLIHGVWWLLSQISSRPGVNAFLENVPKKRELRPFYERRLTFRAAIADNYGRFEPASETLTSR